MKEYKIISWSLSLTNNNQKLENLLNQYASQGWRVIAFGEQTYRIILERDKNR